MLRTRTGRRIELSARDIELFKLLARYRYLRSTYLYAFLGGASETRFKERLGDLFHEGYLDRPPQQWEFADARCRPAVHEIGRGGSNALRAGGMGFEGNEKCTRAAGQRQFLHTLMCCETLASIEIATQATEALRFIPWPEILARAPEATRASPTPYRLPVPSGGYLVPDGVFGIEYRSEGNKSYRFFSLEADRGTMPVSRFKPGQTSYLGKLSVYDEIIRQQIHKSHWGVPNLLVLTATTSAARISEIVAKLGTSNPVFLFKAAEERSLTVPVPELLTSPWQRAGHAPLSIAESY
jgi:hypothetical protein